MRFFNVDNCLVENLTITSKQATGIYIYTETTITNIVARNLKIDAKKALSLVNDVASIIESCILKGAYSGNCVISIASSSVIPIFRNCHIEAMSSNQVGVECDNSTSTAEFQSCKIIGGGSVASISGIGGSGTVKLYNCRIEKGVGASYAITGASGGTVVLGECSLDGDINTALIISYKKDYKLETNVLEFDDDTLKIIADGISGTKLADAVAGNGLSKDGSENLQVNVDDSTIEINADVLRVKNSGITAAKLATDAVETAKIDDEAVTRAKITPNERILPGTIMMWGGSTAPTGWWICDGASKNKNTYTDLFAAIDYNFGGSGDNFNLPDFRNVFPRGANPEIRTSHIGQEPTVDYPALGLGNQANDHMQGHWHNKYRYNTMVNPGAGTMDIDYGGGGNNQASANDIVRGPVTDGTNGTPRVNVTTEPQCLAVHFIIKY